MLFQLLTLFTALVSAFTLPVARHEAGVSANRVTAAPAPDLKGAAAFLIDLTDGRILFSKNADAPLPIASITKLMTALVVYQNGVPWDKEITFEAQDERGGDIPYIIRSETITARDAWNLMLVASSNDAAAMLARAITGEEGKFTGAMQEMAKKLGLKRTHFSDASGLDPGNVSTAREVAVIARVAFTIPEIRATLLQPYIRVTPRGKGYRNIANTDKLLLRFNQGAFETFGGKTGHIEESGYNLVFAAGKDGHDLIGVVLGGQSSEARFDEMRTLLTWGFEQL